MSKLSKIAGYAELTAAQKAEICNGMGAKDNFWSRFIPNTMWGLNVLEAANRHDYRYHVGKTKEAKREADRGFLIDLFIIINNHGGWMAVPRMLRAFTYYLFVHFCGYKAYWKNKTGQNNAN
jgi:hypothetical protein